MMADLGPLSNTYGPLKGWQWAAILGGGAGVFLFIRARNASNAATTSTALTPGTVGNPSAGGLNTIIEQMGPPSITVNVPGAPTALPVSKKKYPVATPKPALPKVTGTFPQVVKKATAFGKSMIKIGSVDKNGVYHGKNVSGGVPVYAYSTARGEYAQGAGVKSPNHDVFIPSQFSAYIA